MIPWENLKLWFGYPLKDGQWLDVSKHLNDGAIIGASWVENGIYFDGIDDYVNCGNHSSLNVTNKLTFEMLIKPEVIDNYDTFMAKTDGSTFRWAFQFDNSTNGYISLYLAGVSPTTLTDNTTPLSINKWYHIAATYNGVIGILYINGKNVKSASMTGNVNSGMENVNVGAALNANNYVKGAIALVRIYDIALTTSQIKESQEQCYRLI